MTTLIISLLCLVILLVFKSINLRNLYYHPFAVKGFEIIDIILTGLCYGVFTFICVWLLEIFMQLYEMIPPEAIYGLSRA